MAFRYLDKDGALSFWTNIKNYILSKIPTKTSELTNDSGYLTSHQSLDNYVTLNSNQTITAIKTITGGNQGKMLFKNPNYTKGDAVESGTTISRLYFGNGASYATANGVLTTDISSAGNTSIELCAMNNTASNSNRASLIITYDKSATSPRLLKSWGNFVPYSSDNYTLGDSSSIWKECYSNAYYLGTTAFGDIVTHNASEFLTEHPSITLSSNTTSTASPSHGGTFTCIDSVTQDTNGHITKVNTKTVTLPSDNNTDTLMTQNVSTTNSTYPILLCPTANATSNQGAKTGIFAKSVKINPSTNVISASGFSGPLTGNVTGNVTGNCSGSSGSCTGNAATATQFSANTTVALTGDATGTSAGSKKGWSVPVTLANSGVTAGTYGPSADVTGNNNATISVPEITVDAKGRVTSVTNRTYTSVNTDTNTDTKVTQTVTTANSNYPVLLCATADATATGTTTSRFSAGLAVNARYSSISMTNKYDTANTKGVRDSTKGYLNGDIIFKCYDASEMGRIHCESSKNGYQQTYMQARSYIKNGTISPEGTATTCYITVRVRDNGSKTIYTDGSWENSLTPYANETYDIGTSSLRWMRCYCKNFYGSYVDIAGRYIGNEYSTNASTCLYLKSKRDTDGQSGIYFSKFRQNRAQGALTGSDLVDLSLDVLENSVRTNSCISISFRYFENDVPTKIYVIPKASMTSYMGTADHPWTNAYITNLILNGNAFDPASTSGNIGDIVFARAYYSAINNLTMTAAGDSLALIRFENEIYVEDRNNQSLSGTWKFLGSTIPTVTSGNASSTCAGVWKRIA